MMVLHSLGTQSVLESDPDESNKNIPRITPEMPFLTNPRGTLLDDYFTKSGGSPGGCKFDVECMAKYGSKTAILYQIQNEFTPGSDNAKYELRTLDNLGDPMTVSKKLFFELIPSLVSKKYTVVIVDYLDGYGHDITAVHSNEVKMFNPIMLF